MAIRMSEYDLKRILSAKKAANIAAKTPVKKKPATRKAAAPCPAASKKGRLVRQVYEGAEVSFTIPIAPRPKERPRTFVDMNATLPRLRSAFISARGDVAKFMGAAASTFSSRTVTPKETRAFEDAVSRAAALAMAGREPFSIPVEVEYELAFAGDPGEWPTAGNDGDLDNCVKAVGDAMNRIIYADDRLVVRSSETKACAAEPFIRVTVRPARA